MKHRIKLEYESRVTLLPTAFKYDIHNVFSDIHKNRVQSSCWVRYSRQLLTKAQHPTF